MKIAYCILTHTDFPHIVRLSQRLSRSGADVYIHVDANADIKPLREELNKVNEKEGAVVLIANRLHCAWGGWNAVAAEIELLRAALAHGTYDRLMFLQGLDYPIKSDAEIEAFFEQNRTLEFIRGCDCSTASDPYFREKCRCYWNFNSRCQFVKKLTNGVNRFFHPEVRSGVIKEAGVAYDVYWGSAQWGLTADAARYIVQWYDEHPAFNRWFYHSPNADELYFQTVIFNSPFREKAMAQGPEPVKKNLANWRSLHYFEYGKAIKIFTSEDLPLLLQQDALYIRKATTAASTPLLDILDQQNKKA